MKILTTLRQELMKNKLLVALWDKNLGVVVISLKQYHKKCKEFLLNWSDTFLPISEAWAIKLESNTLYYIKELLSLGHLNKQTGEFIEEGTQLYFSRIPLFSGLSKIHKNRFVFWLIIPCHSVLAQRTAKVLSNILSSAVKGNPTIIHNSKQVTDMLVKFVIPVGKKKVLLTTIVVSCYTNILIKTLSNMAYRMIYKHSALSSTQYMINALVAQHICCIANNTLIFKYVNEIKYEYYFHQIKN